MKGRLAAFVGVFSIAILVFSGAYAGKPDKPPKPPKPGNTTTECIVFTGDLVGKEEVENCCPNAGPYPAYTMTFVNLASWPTGPHDGQLFTKPVRTRENRKWTVRYKVQFWTWDSDAETPGTGDYFFEIYGDDFVKDETTDVLTVTFTDETGTGWIYHDGSDPTQISIPYVSFVMKKTSDLTYCQQ